MLNVIPLMHVVVCAIKNSHMRGHGSWVSCLIGRLGCT